MRTGLSVMPYVDSLDRIRGLVRLADQTGLDYVGIQDHPYQARFLDAFALIATLLAETHRIAFFTDVANLPLRPPTIMAKAAATLDIASGGRFELGLGAGANWDHIAGVGGPRRSPAEGVDALEEAIEVIRLMWSQEQRVSFNGHHYRLKGARPRFIRLVSGWVPSGPGCSGWSAARQTAGSRLWVRSLAMTSARATGGSTKPRWRRAATLGRYGVS